MTAIELVLLRFSDDVHFAVMGWMLVVVLVWLAIVVLVSEFG